MSDQIVSVRMPKPLVDDLRTLAKKKNFMDLSEEVRFIVRKQCRELKDPQLAEVAKLREQLEEELSRRKSEEQKEILSMMKKLLEDMK